MARRDHDDPHDDAELALDPQDGDRSEPDDDRELDDDGLDDDGLDDEGLDDDGPDDDGPDDDDRDEPTAAPERRRSLGPTLLTLGAGVWAIAAALHCGAPEPGPALSVSPDAAVDAPPRSPPDGSAEATPDSEPADEPDPAEAAEDEPTPASDRPEPDAPQSADSVPDEAPLPEPVPEDWAADPSTPRTISYTIRRGGSIKNVANLFKIYHHEITALNPGVTLEQELPPNSKVVVYEQDTDTSSESVGFPSDGSLEGGVPMVEGPGRVLKMIPWKSWGTAHTVALLDQVLRRWAERGKVQPVLVGNMSSRKGGRLEPHSTHQSGRDVDLSYLQKLPEGEELNWRTMTAQNLDAAETWMLLKLLRSTGKVEVIFIDSSIQKLLYDHAVANDTVPKAALPRWLQYPKSGGRRALVQHVKGHVDHIHVRFKCQPHETRCKSRPR